MIPGENERDRVLTDDEESRYLSAATKVGANIEEAYRRALGGLRARKGEVPIEPEDPYLLRDVTTILIDCALRPEECFRLRWPNVRDGAVHVPFGRLKTLAEACRSLRAPQRCLKCAGPLMVSSGFFQHQLEAATLKNPL